MTLWALALYPRLGLTYDDIYRRQSPRETVELADRCAASLTRSVEPPSIASFPDQPQEW